jgi:hypothetical protein
MRHRVHYTLPTTWESFLLHGKLDNHAALRFLLAKKLPFAVSASEPRFSRSNDVEFRAGMVRDYAFLVYGDQ